MILTTSDETVVLYFFLFLFKFLYAISPPIPNIFFIILGDFIFFDFIFISSLLLIASIGVILLAFLAENIHDKYIVKNPNTMLKIIANIGMLNTNLISF